MSANIPKTQKAYVYRTYSTSSAVLEETELPVPQVGPHDVLVQVAYTGINPVDWKVRSGYLGGLFPQTLPTVPGWDFSGTIAAVGENVGGFEIGDTVYALARPAFELAAAHPESQGEVIGLFDGTAQQYIAIKSWKLSKTPKNVSLAQAAGVPTGGLTAYQALHEVGGIKKGQTVLIPGASGGVGGIGVSVAKAAGAHVIASCSTKNVEYVKKLGADEVIDYTKGPLQEQLKGKQIDLVFDCVGGETTVQAIKAVKKDGLVVSIAAFDVEETAKKEGKVGKVFTAKPSGEMLALIAKLVEEGKLHLLPVEEFPWNKLRESHDLSQTGRAVGKIVVKIE